MFCKVFVLLGFTISMCALASSSSSSSSRQKRYAYNYKISDDNPASLYNQRSFMTYSPDHSQILLNPTNRDLGLLTLRYLNSDYFKNPDSDQTSSRSWFPQLNQLSLKPGSIEHEIFPLISEISEPDQISLKSESPERDPFSLISGSSNPDQISLKSGSPPQEPPTLGSGSSDFDEISSRSESTDHDRLSLSSESSDLDGIALRSGIRDFDQIPLWSGSPDLEQISLRSWSPDFEEASLRWNPDFDQASLRSWSPDLDQASLRSGIIDDRIAKQRNPKSQPYSVTSGSLDYEPLSLRPLNQVRNLGEIQARSMGPVLSVYPPSFSVITRNRNQLLPANSEVAILRSAVQPSSDQSISFQKSYPVPLTPTLIKALTPYLVKPGNAPQVHIFHV